MTEQLMIEILTGPVAALGLCVVCLYAIGWCECTSMGEQTLGPVRQDC